MTWYLFDSEHTVDHIKLIEPMISENPQHLMVVVARTLAENHPESHAVLWTTNDAKVFTAQWSPEIPDIDHPEIPLTTYNLVIKPVTVVEPPRSY